MNSSWTLSSSADRPEDYAVVEFVCVNINNKLVTVSSCSKTDVVPSDITACTSVTCVHYIMYLCLIKDWVVLRNAPIIEHISFTLSD